MTDKLPEYKKLDSDADAGEAYALIANLSIPGREAEVIAVVHQVAVYAMRSILVAAARDIGAYPATSFDLPPEEVQGAVQATLALMAKEL